MYYQCLVLGFMGQYGLGDTDQLRLLITDLRRELDVQDPQRLCDLDAFVDDGAPRERPMPWVTLAVICALLAAGLLGVLYYLSYTGFEAATETVRSLAAN